MHVRFETQRRGTACPYVPTQFAKHFMKHVSFFFGPLVLTTLALSTAVSAQTKPAPAMQDDLVAPAIHNATPQAPDASRSSARRAAPKPPLPPLIIRDRNREEIIETTLYMGEATTFLTPNVARVAVGNGAVLNAAAIDEREVLVFGSTVGVSSLTVWDKAGRYASVKVTVVPADTSRLLREVTAFLKKIPLATAEVVGDKVIVEGDNLSDLDLAKIDELAKRYPQIVNFTNRVGWEQMVLLDVKVVEFPSSFLREIGMQWGTAGGAAAGAVWSPVRRINNGPYVLNIPSQNGNTPLTALDLAGATPKSLNFLGGLNLGVNATLNLIAQEGKGSILAQPQLSTRNGSKASFLAGGEYPYTVATVNGATVQFKPYGIKLEIAPRVDRNGVIRATIDSEVSAIDPSVSTPSGPALTTRRTTTEFNVREGDTLVLAGLLQRRTTTSIDKLPLLGDIPVLGALFRSKRYQNDETELVVFVTPSVVDSRSAGLVDRVERAGERLQEDAGKPPYLPKPLEKPLPLPVSQLTLPAAPYANSMH
jgi:pilus assembly protein CpaC